MFAYLSVNLPSQNETKEEYGEEVLPQRAMIQRRYTVHACWRQALTHTHAFMLLAQLQNEAGTSGLFH